MLDQNEAQRCLIHTLELAEMECSRKLLLATAEVPVAEVISAFAGSRGRRYCSIATGLT